MMKRIEIYIGERYYGSIKIPWPKSPFVMTEEEIHEEVVKRLPTLRNEKYTVAL